MLDKRTAPAAGKLTGAANNTADGCCLTHFNMLPTFIDDYPSLGTAEDAGRILNLRTDAVRQLCREGKIQAIKCGNLWRIPRDWLIEFIMSGGTASSMGHNGNN